jgi:glucosamine 6-phosphate synthetase-like amidotransferase/phosphosugar isomerase protein
MEKTMLDYLEEAPAVLQRIFDARLTLLKPIVDKLANLPCQNIYIVGSGTSCHAGFAVKRLFEEILDIPVYPMFPNAFSDSRTNLGEGTLFIAISQTGESVSTLKALAVAKERGNTCLSLVGENDSDLEKAAGLSLMIDCGEEKAVAKTKGYLATVLTLALLGIELSSRTNMYKELQTVIQGLPDIIEKSIEWAEQIKEELLDKEVIQVVSDQHEIASCMEGSLKLLETVRIGIAGYELEEFMHGPYNAVKEGSALIFIGNPESKYYPRMLKLVDYQARKTDDQYLVSSVADANVKNFSPAFSNSQYFSALEFIIPLQCLAYKLSTAKGINPNIASDPEFHKNMDSKRLK